MGFDFLVHQRFHFMRKFAAETHHTQIIAHEGHRVMIVVKAG